MTGPSFRPPERLTNAQKGTDKAKVVKEKFISIGSEADHPEFQKELVKYFSRDGEYVYQNAK